MCATRRAAPAAALVGSIALRGGGGAALTEQRVRLLEAIEAHGSLNRAAAALPMSYKSAWDALDALNRMADAPLVVRRTGGAAGGGTRLTDEGRRIVALFRALEHTQQSVLDRLPQSEEATSDPGDLRGWVRRLAVRSSARNQFEAEVLALRDMGGSIDVRLTLVGGETIVISVTPESASRMALSPGVRVHALIKAPWVGMALRRPRERPDENLLAGVVQSVQPGRTRTQVRLKTDRGLDVVASLARAPAGLREGVRAFARFDTDSAILLRFDA